MGSLKILLKLHLAEHKQNFLYIQTFNRKNMLTIIFWDVQHGHACYIKTPNGKHIVIDLGVGSHSGNNNAFSPLLHLRQNYGVYSLDGVIITHPHTDHIDDIFNFNKFSPAALFRPNHLTDSDIKNANPKGDQSKVDEYLSISNRYSKPLSNYSNPFIKENNGGVDIQCFIPTSPATSNINNHSVVTVVSYENLTILIPGDNESPSWNELLDKPNFVSAIKDTDILLAPHHGRESGYSERLFEYIHPRLTVISDGRFVETSATDKYSKKSQGWDVHRRSGVMANRKCVTTRNDGVIKVECGKNSNGGNFLSVTVD